MLSNVHIRENFIKLITTMIIIIYNDKEKTTIYVFLIDMQVLRWVPWKKLSFLDAIVIYWYSENKDSKKNQHDFLDYNVRKSVENSVQI